MVFAIFFLFQAKEFGRKAVVQSESSENEELTRDIVEFMKACDKVPTMLQ